MTNRAFSAFANQASLVLGKPKSFIAACVLAGIWLGAGPVFGWSDAWQLVANTATNVITFLMVFVLQNSQNRDSAALQAKLDEVLRSVSPGNHLEGIEDLSQDEILEIKLARLKRKL